MSALLYSLKITNTYLLWWHIKENKLNPPSENLHLLIWGIRNRRRKKFRIVIGIEWDLARKLWGIKIEVTVSASFWVSKLYQVVGCDLTYDTYIFPFLSRVLFIGKSSQSDRLPAFISLLGHFLPMLEQIVFGRSEYVDAGIPDANKEFGSLRMHFEIKTTTTKKLPQVCYYTSFS